jgi:hypothetical protein
LLALVQPAGADAHVVAESAAGYPGGRAECGLGGATRGERINVADAVSGALLDSRTLTAFNAGQYSGLGPAATSRCA